MISHSTYFKARSIVDPILSIGLSVALWTANSANLASPCNFTPCSGCPGEPNCEDWTGQLDGEWNENLHGLPRTLPDKTRYGKRRCSPSPTAMRK